MSAGLRRVLPALGLFFLAPLVAEFLLGNISVTMLGSLTILAPMYGGGALLIREVARRTGRGWPSILMLALAYGVTEEAFMTQSLFNPHYLGLNLLQPAWLPALGIGLAWTLYVLALHTIWSISVPMILMESLVPERRNQPWLKNFGLTVTGVLFLLATVASAMFSIRTDPHHFVAAPAQFAAAAAIVVALALLAFLLPRASAARPRGAAAARPAAPSPWLVGFASLAAGSVFMAAYMAIPWRCGWGSVALNLLLALAAIASIAVGSARTGWTSLHHLALAGGAALAYGIHAFFQLPSVGANGAANRAGNVFFLLGALALIALAARRTAAFHQAG
jgi:uncharacterized protein YhhL (DUF1145 family)